MNREKTLAQRSLLAFAVDRFRRLRLSATIQIGAYVHVTTFQIFTQPLPEL